MTPWGLRNRLKSALGRAPAAAASPTHRLTLVTPEGVAHEVSAEDRYTLVMASQCLEHPIATGCPDGHCGKCAVDVLEDRGLAAPTDAEAKLLKEKAKPGQRLACHARIVGSGGRFQIKETWSLESLIGTS